MKAILKFKVCINDAPRHWESSPEYLSYEEAAEWRHKREAEIFKANPGRRYIPSTLEIVTVYVDDKQGAQ